jgi:FkbM family methyltransferase|tara:strand:- start:458 stop:1135 length:678 start_codon:yes stop_codon:yes gene_type:complete
MALIDAKFFERAKERFNIKFENVLDIGAANGDWSSHVKDFYPDAKFTLIEPNKLHNERLRSLGKVHNVYLSDKVEEREFYVCKDPFQQTGNGFYKEKSNVPFDKQLVNTHTLDSITQDETFDLIKLDVQGAEVEVIKGGMITIPKAKWLQIEVPVFEFNIGSPSMYNLLGNLKAIGFYPFDVAQLLFNVRCLYIDIMFVNRNLPTHESEDSIINFTKYGVKKNNS